MTVTMATSKARLAVLQHQSAIKDLCDMSKLWLTIFGQNVYAPPAAARVKSAVGTDSYPFMIELRNINLKAEGSPGIDYQLRACLYDAQNGRYFGRAWKGTWRKEDGASGRHRIAFSETIYFHIPYKDNSVLCVIELVRRRTQSLVGDEVTTLGWTVLRMMPSLPRNEIPQAQLDMFQGSAQVLTLLSEPVESDVKLKKSGIALQYGLRSHPALRKAYDFVPINTIIGSEEPVPGLEPSDHVAVLSAPMPKMQSLAVIEQVTIHLGPLAQRIESEVCEFMNKERLLKDNRLFDGEVMDILERRIRVGVHNGWTYLREPCIFHLSSSEVGPDTRSLQRKTAAAKQYLRSSSWDAPTDQFSAKGQLSLRNRIEVNELIRDPGIGLVFYYQLLVALQSVKPNPPAKVVTIAWDVWSPFGEATTSTSAKPVAVTLPLRGGPTRNPDGVLCFTDFYSLSQAAGQRDRTSTSAITISFNFNANPKMTEEQAAQPVLDGGTVVQPHPTQRGSIASPGLPSPTTSSRQPTPAPPPRAGRAPLPSAIKRPGQLVDHTAVQPMAFPFPGAFYWPPPAPSLVPSIGAYPLPAPAGRMTELTVTGPIHAPLLALQQQHWRPASIPRSVMAILDQAKFQPIVDRHGECPQLVDVFDTAGFSLESDLKDPLICNEIVLQFMSLARSDDAIQLPDFVYFTFSFYRFPQVTTERLLLTAPEQALPAVPAMPVKILRRVDPSGILVVGAPGFMVKFVVDPEYLKPGEREYFLDYLYNHHLSIDLWNGDSLMLFGSCLLPLRQLCRRNQESVQAYCQIPVVTTEIIGRQDDASRENDGALSDAIHPVMTGLLYLKVACSGHPSAGGLDALYAEKATRNAAVITHSLHSDKIGMALASAERIVLRPRTLASHGVVIRPLMVTARRLQDISDDLPEDKRRKLERLKNIRQIAPSKFNGSLTKECYLRDIQTLNHIREQTKEKTIMSALFQSITTVHSIFPTLGSCEFMEYLLNNPYNESITVDIEIADVELKVVTDAREWQYMKAVNNLLTPMDPSMFSVRPASKPGDKETVQIFLNPRESVYVPLKFHSFRSIDYPEYKEAYQKPHTRVLLPAKNIKTIFRRIDNGDVVSALILQVEPQPHIVHQTFRFYHPENQFLAKYIRIRPEELWEAANKLVEYIFCTDPTVICELRTSGAAGVPQDVFIKAAAGTSPVVKRFNVMLYGDPYLSKPIQIWQLHVHAMRRIDVSTVQGNRIAFPIVLKGDKGGRLVRCFSSAPREASLLPAAPFVLDPGATVDARVLFKPLLAGERTMQITAVDVELREMVVSWLIYASIKPPVITKAYQVVIQTGPPGRTLNKKVSYTNSYNIKKKFHLSSSRDDLMMIKEPSLLELEAGASGVIGLRFNANVPPQVTEILLFINDEQEKNEDTYGIKAIFAAG